MNERTFTPTPFNNPEDFKQAWCQQARWRPEHFDAAGFLVKPCVCGEAYCRGFMVTHRRLSIGPLHTVHGADAQNLADPDENPADREDFGMVIRCSRCNRHVDVFGVGIEGWTIINTSRFHRSCQGTEFEATECPGGIVQRAVCAECMAEIVEVLGPRYFWLPAGDQGLFFTKYMNEWPEPSEKATPSPTDA